MDFDQESKEVSDERKISKLARVRPDDSTKRPHTLCKRHSQPKHKQLLEQKTKQEARMKQKNEQEKKYTFDKKIERETIQKLNNLFGYKKKRYYDSEKAKERYKAKKELELQKHKESCREENCVLKQEE